MIMTSEGQESDSIEKSRELSLRARKLQDELTQRLSKVKSRGVKNPLKKLPGYGSQWFYRKRKEPSPTLELPATSETPQIDSESIFQFVKNLRSFPALNDEEISEEVVQGPGFEFPTEKETAKCNKHWSKKFKNWNPESKSGTIPTSRPLSIRFKAPLPTNEVEVDGKRYRLVENKQEVEELVPRGNCLRKKQPSLLDPKFYAELVAEYGPAASIRVFSQKEDPEVSLTDVESTLSAIYAPFPLASKLVTGIKKKLVAEGKGLLADEVQVELHNTEVPEDDDEDEVQCSSSTFRETKLSPLHHATPLADGDQSSTFQM